jgi:hypothetical protein
MVLACCWLGAFLVVVLVLQGFFHGHRNKELKNKRRRCLKAKKRKKLRKYVKKISDVWCV